MLKKIFLIILVFAGIGLLLKLSSRTNTTVKNRISVVTSFYPLGFLAEEIGKENVTVTTLTPAGAEPHDYEPTPQDLQKIETSDVVILVGPELEPWADSVTAQLAGKPVKLLTAQSLLTQKLPDEDATDPHFWLDPQSFSDFSKQVQTTLSLADPVHRDVYKQNAESLQQKLQTLNQQFEQGFQNCQIRDFVTSHTAFGYLAHRYNLNQIPIAGVSPDAEPSPNRLIEITKLVREKNIHYIFFEELVSPALSETIARETGAETAVLSPLEGLTTEELQSGEDYFSQMHTNLGALQKALSCL